MLRYLSAGESHGPVLTAIIEGLPAGVTIKREYINERLKRRQGGYGRGGRMQIETDEVDFLSGIRNEVTTGSPITLQIKNKDWENWQDIMSPYQNEETQKKKVTKPRPGHADLAGAIKYNHQDMRNILERASARETAIRTAVGATAEAFLENFNIKFFAHVISIGDVELNEIDYNSLSADIYENPFYCIDEKYSKDMIKAVDKARENGDSLGGIFEVVVFGLPTGLGSHVQWDRRLDGRLAKALMSVQAIKGVEIGLGFKASELPGSMVHDQIYHNHEQGFYRKTNNAGGIEGGITNGETLIIKAAMKPIPTLYSPLDSVDFISKEPYKASIERSDNCAVPAASAVGQAAIAWELADAFLEKFSGDSMQEIKKSFDAYQEYIKKL